MPQRRETPRITLPEALGLLVTRVPTEEARARLEKAFVTKAVLGQPNFALSYDQACIDWATGDVVIPRKRESFRPTFSPNDIDMYFPDKIDHPPTDSGPIDPDINWYLGISRERSVTPRCPFASIDRCPRCYESRSLLGSAGSTKIPPEEDDRLKAHWEKTDLWPKTGEEGAYITGNGERFNSFGNFCPEVAYERFKFFAASFSYNYDEIDRECVQERLSSRQGRIANWEWNWTHVTPMHFTECPLYSPLSHSPPNLVIKQSSSYDARSGLLGKMERGAETATSASVRFVWELVKIEIKKLLHLQ